MGAPFDGDGKVFIYRGSDAGIETKPAQVSFTQQFRNELTEERKDDRKNKKLIDQRNQDFISVFYPVRCWMVATLM